MSRSQRDGSQVLADIADRSGMPVGVHLQVADRCNHTCRHCYQIQGRKGELSLEQIKSILDDLAASGILMLSISGGEATLRDDLIPILDYARAKGFAVRLYSNGYAIDDELADGIANAHVLEVHVSVYSGVPADHDAVTCVPGSLHRTLDAIRRLRSRNVRVVMKTPPVAAGGADTVRNLAAELGCEFRLSVDVSAREDGSTETKRTEESPEAIIARGAVDPWCPTSSERELRTAKLAEAPCGVCSSAVAVMPNGDVRPCTDTIADLGNLTERSFREIYTGNPAVNFLRKLSWGDMHGCRDCDLLNACGRCNASAVHEAGDYLGPYETACRMARARYAAALGHQTVLAPSEECERGRTALVGPYKIEEPGTLRPVPDRQTEKDRALARDFAWLRPNGEFIREMIGGSPNTRMVQIRRSREGVRLGAHQPAVDKAEGA